MVCLGGWALDPNASRRFQTQARVGQDRVEMEIEWGSKGGQGSLQLDTGAKPAALVTGNVGREATEMSPVSGLDPGRTRWVNLLGRPTGWNHWVECRREGGLWDPTRSRVSHL